MAGIEWFDTDRFGEATELSFEDHLCRCIVEVLLAKAASGVLPRNPTVRVPIAGHMLGLLPVDRTELRARLERAVLRAWDGPPLGTVRVLCETMTPARSHVEVVHPGDRDAVPTAGLRHPQSPQAGPAAPPHRAAPRQQVTAPSPPAARSLIRIMTGVRLFLPAQGITFGRAVPAPGRLQDERAGRRHCHVLPTRPGVRCVDLRSTNGTWVDGVRIDGSADVLPGQVIRIGDTEFAVDGPHGRNEYEPS
ncbi:FHA domain-containing protein [Amycolatopsis balhimycina]|nr:FHA domain-containing protein [Amycolatopsis balhimycina]